MSRMCRVRDTGEQGSALAIALTFLMVFGLLIGVVLQFAATGQRTTLSVRDDATNTYSGGGAVDGAINMLSQTANIAQGLGGAPCSSFTLPASTGTALALDNASGVVVSCTPLPLSGVAGVAGTTTTITATATVASSVTLGTNAWTSPNLATTAGGGSATTRTFTGDNGESTTLRIGPFAAAPVVPDTATAITVRAMLIGSASRGRFTAVLRTPGAVPLLSPAVTYACTTTCGPAAQPSPNITTAGGVPLTSSSVNGASIDINYTKTANNSATPTIDVVTLSITYTIPLLRRVLLVAKDESGTGRTLAQAQVWFAAAAAPTLNGAVPTVKQWVAN